ncbi:hypothetical protein KP509_20G067600 [Ceratopteris richardii]|uniref:J domain-containing protein n=1 Tax=Ceratopteris richardii TaxID=49495 RepID=A0A8T2SG06_CERRI|nr:hypothetical protein KP509_20G067600 [Ceratopteris richardii]
MMDFCSMLSPRSPSSSSSPIPCPSASSAAASSFSSSPSGSILSSPPVRSAIDTDFSSSSSSFPGSSRPFTGPIKGPPRLTKRPHPINVSSYTTSTEAYSSTAGINTTATPRATYYSVLGVSPTSTPREIRAAYRRLALQHHPDVSPLHQLDKSTKIFAQINEAYTVLSDPQKKACYDMKLTLQTKSAPASPMYRQRAATPRAYTDDATGRVYPSMNSFYREWRRSRN